MMIGWTRTAMSTGLLMMMVLTMTQVVERGMVEAAEAVRALPHTRARETGCDVCGKLQPGRSSCARFERRTG
jgi:N-acetylglucosamine-6-phosphate deacetylase